MTEKEKNKLIDLLFNKTGFNKRRCKNYLEQFNWNLDKTLEYPVIKNSLRKEESLFEFDFENTSSSNSTESEIKETSQKSKKQRSKTKKSKKGSTVSETKETLLKSKKRTNGGITFEVEIIGNQETFEGRVIHMDESGFYHPYPTMKQINQWTHQYLKNNKKGAN